MKCAYCGSELKNNEKICGACGRNVEPLKLMFCPNCGAKLGMNSRFCSLCGAAINLKEDSFESDIQSTKEREPIREGLSDNANSVDSLYSNASKDCKNVKLKNSGSTKKNNQNNYLIIMMAGIVFCLASIFAVIIIKEKSGNNSSDDTRYKLYVDISSNSNLIFNKYDICVFLDGKELGSVANGDRFTYLAEVNQGDHEIVFCKSGNSKPKNTKKISISGDMTYSCDLSHDGSSIKIKNEKVTDNITGALLMVINVTGLALPDAKTHLSNIGFINIREEPHNDIWDADNWIVEDQSINEGSVVDKNTCILLNCVKGDKFFSDLYSGKNINEIQQLAENVWFKLEFLDSSYNTLDVSTMNESEKASWVASRVIYDGKERKTTVYVDHINDVDNKQNSSTSTPTPKPTDNPITNKPSSAPTTKPTNISEGQNNPSDVPSQTSSIETTNQKSDIKTLVSKTVTYFNKDGTIASGEYYEYDYKGNVKRHSYRNSYGINIDDEYFEYDSKGNITKETFKGSDGTITWWAEYKYDEKGNVIEWEKHFSSGRDRERSGRYELEYDENDRLIKKAKPGKYGPTGWDEYEYDKSGNLIKASNYSVNSELNSVTKYEYDKSGNMTRETHYSKNNQFEHDFKYEYDKSNRLIKKSVLNEKGKVISWEKYEYDEKGNEIKSSRSDGSWSESAYKYL